MDNRDKPDHRHKAVSSSRCEPTPDAAKLSGNLWPLDSDIDTTALSTDPLSARRQGFLLDQNNVTTDSANRSCAEDLFAQLCLCLRTISSASAACIATGDASWQRFTIRAFSSSGTSASCDASAHGDRSDDVWQHELSRGDGLCGTALARGQTVHLNRQSMDDASLRLYPGIVDAIAVPIHRQGRSFGVLALLFNEVQATDRSNEVLYEKFAAVVAGILDNAHREEGRQQEINTLEAMLRINQAIYESDDHRTIVDSISNMVIDGFRAGRTRIYRFTENRFIGLTGKVLVGAGITDEALPSDDLLRHSANAWVVKNLKSAHVKVGVDDARETPELHAFRKACNIGCSYIMPLICTGEAWGVLSVHRDIGENDFNEDEKRLLDLLSSQLSLTIYRQELMDRIEHQANFDQLTGLANRSRFESVLSERVQQAREAQQELALLFVDLDGFKAVNDTMGHVAGDELLRHVADLMSAFAQDDIVISRLGGDEFGVLTPLGYAAAQTDALAHQIVRALEVNRVIKGLPVATHASMGIARFPSDGDTGEELLVNADIAMYQAKRAGTGLVRHYDAEFAYRHTRRLTLRKKLEAALGNREFSLVYQPKVCTRTRRVVAAEALIRWNTPDFHNVSPAEWIPLAEETGIMLTIDRWVLGEACKAVNRFEAAGLGIKLSVNVSATHFVHDDFTDATLATIARQAASKECLEIEITETALIEELHRVIEKLRILRDAGLSIAIDDFGIKYSSLAYLAELPVDVLKIDKQFVDRLEDPERPCLVEPIIMLAKSLGLKTVAEGVESAGQLDKVLAMGCDMIQGYFYSPAVTADELPAVIRSINSAAGAGEIDDAA